MTEDPDERETSTTWSAGVAKWSPITLSVSRTVKKRWVQRAEDFQEQIAAAAGEPDVRAIGERVDEAEEFGDLWATATDKAMRLTDGPLRTLLAQLVSRALKDDAKIDEIAYLTSVAAQLEPVHLRYLQQLSDWEVMRQATGASGGNILVRAIATELGLDVAIAQSAAERLHSLALLTDRLSGDMVNWTPEPAGAFALTPLGMLLLQYVSGIVIADEACGATK